MIFLLKAGPLYQTNFTQFLFQIIMQYDEWSFLDSLTFHSLGHIFANYVHISDWAQHHGIHLTRCSDDSHLSYIASICNLKINRGSSLLPSFCRDLIYAFQPCNRGKACPHCVLFYYIAIPCCLSQLSKLSLSNKYEVPNEWICSFQLL